MIFKDLNSFKETFSGGLEKPSDSNEKQTEISKLISNTEIFSKNLDTVLGQVFNASEKEKSFAKGLTKGFNSLNSFYLGETLKSIDPDFTHEYLIKMSDSAVNIILNYLDHKNQNGQFPDSNKAMDSLADLISENDKIRQKISVFDDFFTVQKVGTGIFQEYLTENTLKDFVSKGDQGALEKMNNFLNSAFDYDLEAKKYFLNEDDFVKQILSKEFTNLCVGDISTLDFSLNNLNSYLDLYNKITKNTDFLRKNFDYGKASNVQKISYLLKTNKVSTGEFLNVWKSAVSQYGTENLRVEKFEKNLLFVTENLFRKDKEVVRDYANIHLSKMITDLSERFNFVLNEKELMDAFSKVNLSKILKNPENISKRNVDLEEFYLSNLSKRFSDLFSLCDNNPFLDLYLKGSPLLKEELASSIFEISVSGNISKSLKIFDGFREKLFFAKDFSEKIRRFFPNISPEDTFKLVAYYRDNLGMGLHDLDSYFEKFLSERNELILQKEDLDSPDVLNFLAFDLIPSISENSLDREKQLKVFADNLFYKKQEQLSEKYLKLGKELSEFEAKRNFVLNSEKFVSVQKKKEALASVDKNLYEKKKEAFDVYYSMTYVLPVCDDVVQRYVAKSEVVKNKNHEEVSNVINEIYGLSDSSALREFSVSEQLGEILSISQLESVEINYLISQNSIGESMVGFEDSTKESQLKTSWGLYLDLGYVSESGAKVIYEDMSKKTNDLVELSGRLNEILNSDEYLKLFEQISSYKDISEVPDDLKNEIGSKLGRYLLLAKNYREVQSKLLGIVYTDELLKKGVLSGEELKKHEKWVSDIKNNDFQASEKIGIVNSFLNISAPQEENLDDKALTGVNDKLIAGLFEKEVSDFSSRTDHLVSMQSVIESEQKEMSKLSTIEEMIQYNFPRRLTNSMNEMADSMERFRGSLEDTKARLEDFKKNPDTMLEKYNMRPEFKDAFLRRIDLIVGNIDEYLNSEKSPVNKEKIKILRDTSANILDNYNKNLDAKFNENVAQAIILVTAVAGGVAFAGAGNAIFGAARVSMSKLLTSTAANAAFTATEFATTTALMSAGGVIGSRVAMVGTNFAGLTNYDMNKVFDPQAMGKEFLVGWGISVAAIGAGRVLGGTFSKFASASKSLTEADTILLRETLESGAEKSIIKEIAEETGEEVAEDVVEKVGNKFGGFGNVASFLLSTAFATSLNRRSLITQGKNGELIYDAKSPQEFAQMIEQSGLESVKVHDFNPDTGEVNLEFKDMKTGEVSIVPLQNKYLESKFSSSKKTDTSLSEVSSPEIEGKEGGLEEAKEKAKIAEQSSSEVELPNTSTVFKVSDLPKHMRDLIHLNKDMVSGDSEIAKEMVSIVIQTQKNGGPFAIDVLSSLKVAYGNDLEKMKFFSGEIVRLSKKGELFVMPMTFAPKLFVGNLEFIKRVSEFIENDPKGRDFVLLKKFSEFSHLANGDFEKFKESFSVLAEIKNRKTQRDFDLFVGLALGLEFDFSDFVKYGNDLLSGKDSSKFFESLEMFDSTLSPGYRYELAVNGENYISIDGDLYEIIPYENSLFIRSVENDVLAERSAFVSEDVVEMVLPASESVFEIGNRIDVFNKNLGEKKSDKQSEGLDSTYKAKIRKNGDSVSIELGTQFSEKKYSLDTEDLSGDSQFTIKKTLSLSIGEASYVALGTEKAFYRISYDGEKVNFQVVENENFSAIGATHSSEKVFIKNGNYFRLQYDYNTYLSSRKIFFEARKDSNSSYELVAKEKNEFFDYPILSDDIVRGTDMDQRFSKVAKYTGDHLQENTDYSFDLDENEEIFVTLDDYSENAIIKIQRNGDFFVVSSMKKDVFTDIKTLKAGTTVKLSELLGKKVLASKTDLSLSFENGKVKMNYLSEQTVEERKTNSKMIRVFSDYSDSESNRRLQSVYISHAKNQKNSFGWKEQKFPNWSTINDDTYKEAIVGERIFKMDVPIGLSFSDELQYIPINGVIKNHGDTLLYIENGNPKPFILNKENPSHSLKNGVVIRFYDFGLVGIEAGNNFKGTLRVTNNKAKLVEFKKSLVRDKPPEASWFTGGSEKVSDKPGKDSGTAVGSEKVSDKPGKDLGMTGGSAKVTDNSVKDLGTAVGYTDIANKSEVADFFQEGLSEGKNKQLEQNTQNSNPNSTGENIGNDASKSNNLGVGMSFKSDVTGVFSDTSRLAELERQSLEGEVESASSADDVVSTEPSVSQAFKADATNVVLDSQKYYVKDDSLEGEVESAPSVDNVVAIKPSVSQAFKADATNVVLDSQKYYVKDDSGSDLGFEGGLKASASMGSDFVRQKTLKMDEGEAKVLVEEGFSDIRFNNEFVLLSELVPLSKNEPIEIKIEDLVYVVEIDQTAVQLKTTKNGEYLVVQSDDGFSRMIKKGEKVLYGFDLLVEYESDGYVKITQESDRTVTLGEYVKKDQKYKDFIAQRLENQGIKEEALNDFQVEFDQNGDVIGFSLPKEVMEVLNPKVSPERKAVLREARKREYARRAQKKIIDSENTHLNKYYDTSYRDEVKRINRNPVQISEKVLPQGTTAEINLSEGLTRIQFGIVSYLSLKKTPYSEFLFFETSTGEKFHIKKGQSIIIGSDISTGLNSLFYEIGTREQGVSGSHFEISLDMEGRVHIDVLSRNGVEVESLSEDKSAGYAREIRPQDLIGGLKASAHMDSQISGESVVEVESKLEPNIVDDLGVIEETEEFKYREAQKSLSGFMDKFSKISSDEMVKLAKKSPEEILASMSLQLGAPEMAFALNFIEAYTKQMNFVLSLLNNPVLREELKQDILKLTLSKNKNFEDEVKFIRGVEGNLGHVFLLLSDADFRNFAGNNNSVNALNLDIGFRDLPAGNITVIRESYFETLSRDKQKKLLQHEAFHGVEKLFQSARSRYLSEDLLAEREFLQAIENHEEGIYSYSQFASYLEHIFMGQRFELQSEIGAYLQEGKSVQFIEANLSKNYGSNLIEALKRIDSLHESDFEARKLKNDLKEKYFELMTSYSRDLKLYVEAGAKIYNLAKSVNPLLLVPVIEWADYITYLELKSSDLETRKKAQAKFLVDFAREQDVQILDDSMVKRVVDEDEMRIRAEELNNEERMLNEERENEYKIAEMRKMAKSLNQEESRLKFKEKLYYFKETYQDFEESLFVDVNFSSAEKLNDYLDELKGRFEKLEGKFKDLVQSDSSMFFSEKEMVDLLRDFAKLKAELGKKTIFEIRKFENAARMQGGFIDALSEGDLKPDFDLPLKIETEVESALEEQGALDVKAENEFESWQKNADNFNRSEEQIREKNEQKYRQIELEKKVSELKKLERMLVVFNSRLLAVKNLAREISSSLKQNRDFENLGEIEAFENQIAVKLSLINDQLSVLQEKNSTGFLDTDTLLSLTQMRERLESEVKEYFSFHKTKISSALSFVESPTLVSDNAFEEVQSVNVSSELSNSLDSSGITVIQSSSIISETVDVALNNSVSKESEMLLSIESDSVERTLYGTEKLSSFVDSVYGLLKRESSLSESVQANMGVLRESVSSPFITFFQLANFEKALKEISEVYPRKSYNRIFDYIDKLKAEKSPLLMELMEVLNAGKSDFLTGFSLPSSEVMAGLDKENAFIDFRSRETELGYKKTLESEGSFDRPEGLYDFDFKFSNSLLLNLPSGEKVKILKSPNTTVDLSGFVNTLKERFSGESEADTKTLELIQNYFLKFNLKRTIQDISQMYVDLEGMNIEGVDFNTVDLVLDALWHEVNNTPATLLVVSNGFVRILLPGEELVFVNSEIDKTKKVNSTAVSLKLDNENKLSIGLRSLDSNGFFKFRAEKTPDVVSVIRTLSKDSKYPGFDKPVTVLSDWITKKLVVGMTNTFIPSKDGHPFTRQKLEQVLKESSENATENKAQTENETIGVANNQTDSLKVNTVDGNNTQILVDNNVNLGSENLGVSEGETVTLEVKGDGNNEFQKNETPTVNVKISNSNSTFDERGDTDIGLPINSSPVQDVVAVDSSSSPTLIERVQSTENDPIIREKSSSSSPTFDEGGIREQVLDNEDALINNSDRSVEPLGQVSKVEYTLKPQNIDFENNKETVSSLSFKSNVLLELLHLQQTIIDVTGFISSLSVRAFGTIQNKIFALQKLSDISLKFAESAKYNEESSFENKEKPSESTDFVKEAVDIVSSNVVAIDSRSLLSTSQMYSAELSNNGIFIGMGEGAGVRIIPKEKSTLLVYIDVSGNETVRVLSPKANQLISLKNPFVSQNYPQLYIENTGDGKVKFMLSPTSSEVDSGMEQSGYHPIILKYAEDKNLVFVDGQKKKESLKKPDALEQNEAIELANETVVERLRLKELAMYFNNRIKIPGPISEGNVKFSKKLQDSIENSKTLGFNQEEELMLREYRDLILKYEEKLNRYQSEYLERTNTAFEYVTAQVNALIENREGVSVHTRKGKDPNRILEKYIFETDMDEMKINDIRGMIVVVDTPAQLQEFINFFNSIKFEGIDGVRVKTEEVGLEGIKASTTGFSQYFARLALTGTNNTIEVQVHVKEVFDLNHNGVVVSKKEIEDFGFTKNELMAISPDFVNNDSAITINGHRLYELIRSTENEVFKTKLIALNRVLNLDAFSSYSLRNVVRDSVGEAISEISNNQ
ncbi:MAG: hypothetical protein RBS56_03275 [Candidatus Gracilibacteria bacterium]|jgi:hypothetical protein|nr:hypothetical protein [Candidatus Gracilibacteria bacterium]